MKRIFFITTLGLLGFVKLSAQIEVRIFYDENWNECIETKAVFYVDYFSEVGTFSQNYYKKKYSTNFPNAWSEKVFKKDGSKVSSGHFDNGYYNNEWNRYHANGNLKSKVVYINGVLLNAKFYDEENQLLEERLNGGNKILTYYTSGNKKEVSVKLDNDEKIDSLFRDSGELLSVKWSEKWKTYKSLKFYKSGEIYEEKLMQISVNFLKRYTETGDLVYEEKEKDGEVISYKTYIENYETEEFPNKEEEEFAVVEEMPLWGDCSESSKEKNEQCHQKELMTFLGGISYPVFARDNDIEGKEFIRFVVSESGKIEQISVARGSNTILTEWALRHISTMPKWIPGFQNGKAVKVQYVVPINFKLG